MADAGPVLFNKVPHSFLVTFRLKSNKSITTQFCQLFFLVQITCLHYNVIFRYFYKLQSACQAKIGLDLSIIHSLPVNIQLDFRLGSLTSKSYPVVHWYQDCYQYKYIRIYIKNPFSKPMVDNRIPINYRIFLYIHIYP